MKIYNPPVIADIPASEIIGPESDAFAFFGPGPDNLLTADNNLGYNGVSVNWGVPGNIVLGANLDIHLDSDDLIFEASTLATLDAPDIHITALDDLFMDCVDFDMDATNVDITGTELISLTSGTSIITLDNDTTDLISLVTAGRIIVDTGDEITLHSDTFLELDCDFGVSIFSDTEVVIQSLGGQILMDADLIDIGTDTIVVHGDFSFASVSLGCQIQGSTDTINITSANLNLDSSNISFGSLFPVASVQAQTHYVEMDFDGAPWKVLLSS